MVLTYPPEKSSSNWLSLQKGLSGSGHWRSATCRLSEEGERCLLNVYVDVRSKSSASTTKSNLHFSQESILYQTIYIHLLNQTDIRQTDNSLFYRKDCLGIFSIASVSIRFSLLALLVQQVFFVLFLGVNAGHHQTQLNHYTYNLPTLIRVPPGRPF